MPLSPELAARIAQTSSVEELTEDELDELTMAWLEDDGRLDDLDDADPIEEIPEFNEILAEDGTA